MSGSEVESFEREFAAKIGGSAALAVTNGTHALEVALHAHGIGRGDAVIIPAHTFISTALAVQSVGATVVPVDIDAETWCIDPAAAASALSGRTAAIMPVHLAGHVADMDSLTETAKAAGIAIVQDAAQAHGATWRHSPLGRLGATAAFSFQNAKLVTAGEGGAIVFPDGCPHLVERAFLAHNCGRGPSAVGYAHVGAGSNFRMTEFVAAILRVQLGHLDDDTRVRERNAALLRDLLADVDGIALQGRDQRCTRHPHYMVVAQVDGDRDWFVEALCAEGVPALRAYPPIYESDMFWHAQARWAHPLNHWRSQCPITEQLGRRGFWLHHRLLLGTPSDVEQIAQAVKKVAAARPVSPSTRVPTRAPSDIHSARCRRPPRVVAVGVVGLGWAAREIWLPRLAAHPEFEIAAVGDVDEGALAAARDIEPHAAAINRLDDLSQHDLDLLFVLTPNTTHTAVAAAALKQGVDVFVEKPLCITIDDLAVLECAAASTGTRIAVSTPLRFRADIQALRRVALAQIGPLRTVELTWLRRNGVPAPGSWYTARSCGGGALNDLGSHLIDLGSSFLNIDDGSSFLAADEIATASAVTWPIAQRRHGSEGEGALARAAVWRDQGAIATHDSLPIDAEGSARGVLSLAWMHRIR